MKKISNEVKVGATVLLTVLVFVWLFNFLKGKDYFKSTASYYAVYDKIGGLAESSPVEINGFKVGVVRSIDFIDATSGRLLVVFSVSKDFRLPKNTVAEIVPVSLLGGMKVQFVYGAGPGTYSNGDTIPGQLAVSLLDKVETEILPLKDKIAGLITSLDSVVTSVDQVLGKDFNRNLNGTLANLNHASGSLDNILGSKESDIKAIIANLDKFAQMLSENSGKLNGTFTNLKSISDSLAAADIYTTVTNLKASLGRASLLLDNLNEGKGSAGQFLTNDSLYINLNHSMASLNELLTDLKSNPRRYVHFSLLGKKNSPSK